MKSAITLLRVSFWAGAILDGLNVIPLLFPEIGGYIFGLSDFNPGREYRYISYTGASLMLGWTVLLIWADRKPLERKDIIFITVVPVIIGIALAGIFGFFSGAFTFSGLLPTLIMQCNLTILFLYSYFFAIYQERRAVQQHK